MVLRKELVSEIVAKRSCPPSSQDFQRKTHAFMRDTRNEDYFW